MLFFLILHLVSLSSIADTCPSLDGKAGLIIGGRGSTTEEMAKCYAVPADLVAVGEADGARMIDCFAREIDGLGKGARKFVVAGHSSGAAHAEHVVQKLGDKSKVRLVLLEGIGSPLNQKGVETNCFYAKNGASTGFNGPAMTDKKNCPGGAIAIASPHCGENSLCLHLSLVNSAALPELTPKNVFTRGLENCQGNREWLKQAPKAAPEETAPEAPSETSAQ